jgi:hypothetical protein
MGRTGWILLAAVLLIIGVGSLFVEGISYVTQETVVEAGPLELSAEREERVSLPLWASVILVAGGTLALLKGAGDGTG